MQKWFESNGWAVAIGIIGIASSYAVFGYRIAALEAQAAVSQTTVTSLNTQQQAIEVSLARIETDIQYIKISLQSKGITP